MAKVAHDTVLEKIHASVVKMTLTAIMAPHVETGALITKLYEFAKTIDLGVSTILAEQIKYPIL